MDRFHVAVCSNIKDDVKMREERQCRHTWLLPCVPSFFFLPHLDVTSDLLLNRCAAKWNLFVKCNECWQYSQQN